MGPLGRRVRRGDDLLAPAVEMKTAAGLLITGFTRQHIISLPRSSWKRILYEELARFLDVPGGEKIVAESYAQLRKFNCWTASIVQQYSRFKDARIRPVVIGNSKQFFLMRQNDRGDLADLARDLGGSVDVRPVPGGLEIALALVVEPTTAELEIAVGG